MTWKNLAVIMMVGAAMWIMMVAVAVAICRAST